MEVFEYLEFNDFILVLEELCCVIKKCLIVIVLFYELEFLWYFDC